MTRLRIDVSVCFDSEALPWVPFRPAGVPEGLRLRPLRRLDDGRLRSAVVRIPAGWSSGGQLTLRTRQQMFVLTGTLRLGDLALAENAYVCQPAGSVMPEFGSETGAEMILVADGTPAFALASEGDDGVEAYILEDAYSVPYFEPEINGWVLSGIEHRTLWRDEETGADTRLLKMPGGFEGGGTNWHPCNEEIFCLAGDIGPDDDRLLKSGWYLWNPAYAVHEYHGHSIGGCTVLEWHDGDWSLNMHQAEEE